MRLLNILILTAISHCLAFSSALAVEPGRSINGCGPDGILGHIVPNRIRVVNCELEKACNAHDICYGRCLKGGDLHGSPTCNDREAKRRRRVKCDEALFSSIGSANGNRLACRAAASLYKNFVRLFGSTLFAGLAPPDHAREELYRAPPHAIESEYFPAASSTLPIDAIMKRNYEAVEAFVRYAESNPDKLTRAQIDSALDSIATHAIATNYALEFRSSPSGAELLLKLLKLQPDTPPEWFKDEIVIWREGS